jgi:hypothetical protein
MVVLPPASVALVVEGRSSPANSWSKTRSLSSATRPTSSMAELSSVIASILYCVLRAM